MIIRAYQSEDCRKIAELFYHTVHTINAADYKKEQLDAWAAEQADLDSWNRTLQKHFSLVAEKNGILTGFGDIDQTGYLDRLYVHKDYQGQGIASAICDWLERQGIVLTNFVMEKYR